MRKTTVRQQSGRRGSDSAVLRLLWLVPMLVSLPIAAALPPGAADELKANAPEVVDVEVVAVATGTPADGRFSAEYRARVLGVERSADGLAPGAEIEIDSFALEPGTMMLGPKPPPLLSVGWRGRVWLRPAPAGDRLGTLPRFVPAAYGHGFEPRP